MIKSKKELLQVITFTITLIFAFIYIRTIFSFVNNVFRIIMPFILGLVIAFVLNVLMNKIEKDWLRNTKVDTKSKRVISLCLSLAIVIGFIALLGLLIIPELKNTIIIFSENLPTYERNIIEFLEGVGISLGDQSIFNSFFDNLTLYFKNNSDNIVNATLGVATNVVSTVMNVVIAIVFAIYLLAQKEKLMAQFSKLLRAYAPKKVITKLKKISDISHKTFSNFVTGQCLEACIIGALCFMGMFILRLPYALTISVLVGFTALIPVFGALIGTIIGAFLIFMISPFQAIIFIIFVIVLQQFEGNLIYPKVVGKSVNLPSIWVLVAVTIGASINGVVGMLLSVPICSICYSVLVANVNSRLKNKN